MTNMNANQLICLSTFDISTIGPAVIAANCPSCGFRVLNLQQENILNRYSSVALLLGASVYVMYKISDFCPQMKRISNKFWKLLGYECSRLEPVVFINTISRPLVEFNESNPILFTSNTDIPDLELPVPKTPKSALWSQLDLYLNNNNTFSDKNSSDFAFIDNNSKTSHILAKNRTVAKIDEVLTQIDDIKKSIVEIDSQIFDFSGTKCANFNPEFFTLINTDLTDDFDDLRPDDQSEGLIDEDLNGFASTPLQEVHLEWDLMDVQIDSLYYGNEGLEVKSALSLPVTDSDKQRIKSMQELLEEAKQMGLLNNILDAITHKVNDNHSRDSAYFEE